MRSTLNKIALTAILTIATISTTNCSSDDSGDSGSGSSIGNLPDIPKKVHLEDGTEYKGNADITIAFSKYGFEGHFTSCSGEICTEGCFTYNGETVECTDEQYEERIFVPAGKIQAGQLSLNLPASIDSKYLMKFKGSHLDCGNKENCQISVVPQDITIHGLIGIYATIPSKSDCRLVPVIMKSSNIIPTGLVYFSESGKITGTWTFGYNGDIRAYNMNFSKGWNLVYGNDDYDLTTDISKNDEFIWALVCDDE